MFIHPEITFVSRDHFCDNTKVISDHFSSRDHFCVIAFNYRQQLQCKCESQTIYFDISMSHWSVQLLLKIAAVRLIKTVSHELSMMRNVHLFLNDAKHILNLK